MTPSGRSLAQQVISLRNQVLNFEQEMEEALAKQCRQLRPGLVTMKMSPRVQERANQLFGSTDIGTGFGPARAGNLTLTQKRTQGGEGPISASMEDVEDVPTCKDVRTMPTHTPLSEQETLASGPYHPRIGLLRPPRARKGSGTPKSKNLNTKTLGNKSSKSK